jgi:hypothetical protein
MSGIRCARKLSARLLVVPVAWLTALSPCLPSARADGDEKEMLLMSHWGAREAFNKAVLPLDAILVATRAGGGRQVVTWGTVTVSDTPGEAPSYEPMPKDRLIWKRPDRPVVEFVVTEMDGKLGDREWDFLRRNHLLKFRVAVRGDLNLEVERSRKGGNYEARLKGSVVLHNQDATVALSMKGVDYFETDDTGYESRDDHKLAGNIQRPDLQLTVDELSHWRTIKSSGSPSASETWRTFKNKVVAGSKTYQWEKVQLTRHFRENFLTYWDCQGRVLLGGQPFATYGLDDAQTHVVVKITTPSGEVEVERWRKH